MDLPEEMILEVLSYIPLRRLMAAMAVVSRKCYRLVHMSVLWRRLSLCNVGCITYTKLVLTQIFYRHGTDFRYVYFGGNYSSCLLRSDVEVALAYCTNLVSLDIGTNGFITGLSFLSCMHKLKRFVVDFCTEINLDQFVYIHHCSVLEELSMFRCYQLTFHVIKSVAKELPVLKRLNIEGAFEVDVEQIDSLLELGSIVKFGGTPADHVNAESWKSLVTKYRHVVFNEAIVDLSEPSEYF